MRRKLSKTFLWRNVLLSLRKFGKVFLHKLHLKCIQNVSTAIINDNNNFAPSLFRSLCDCIWQRYFFCGSAASGAALPQKNTSVQNNHLRYHTMTSKRMVRSYYCLIQSCLGVTFGPQICKGDPRPHIPHCVMASSAMGLKLKGLRFLPTTHAKTNAKQMHPRSWHTV